MAKQHPERGTDVFRGRPAFGRASVGRFLVGVALAAIAVDSGRVKTAEAFVAWVWRYVNRSAEDVEGVEARLMVVRLGELVEGGLLDLEYRALLRQDEREREEEQGDDAGSG